MEIIYTDGGCVQKNPSSIGITWAWVRTIDGKMVNWKSGFIPTSDKFPGTNNVAEYVAVVEAMEDLPEGWDGEIHSDSLITIGRIFGTWRNKNLPQHLIDRKNSALYRLGKVVPKHLDGHPTKAQLLSGVGKRGNPVSEHNVYADYLCGQEARKVILSNHYD